jgi:hypothetical protein
MSSFSESLPTGFLRCGRSFVCFTLQKKEYKEGFMEEEAKKKIAVFRFGVIADLVGRKLNRGEKERILREKTAPPWDIPR